jgi:methionyl-tRNA formyltransferase
MARGVVDTMRVVAMNAFLPGYRLVADWAERHGHEIVLVVTLPAAYGLRRYGESRPVFVSQLPDGQDVVMTSKLRTLAPALIAPVEPDLVISAAFPRLIPPEILAIPKLGAVNLHPSPLPAGRGPNPQRMIYEGAAELGATLHRTAGEFDTGAVLSQRRRPMPADLHAADLFRHWSEMLAEVLDEGVGRLVAGDAGTPQDDAAASYAGTFTEAEHQLDLTEPARVVQRKAAALNMLAPAARLQLDGADLLITDVDVLADTTGTPGTTLRREPSAVIARAADTTVRLHTS